MSYDRMETSLEPLSNNNSPFTWGFEDFVDLAPADAGPSEPKGLMLNGRKVSCFGCIKGHRSTKCIHKNARELYYVRKAGRPVTSCNHGLCAMQCNNENKEMACCDHVNCERTNGWRLAQRAATPNPQGDEDEDDEEHNIQPATRHPGRVTKKKGKGASKSTARVRTRKPVVKQSGDGVTHIETFGFEPQDLSNPSVQTNEAPPYEPFTNESAPLFHSSTNHLSNLPVQPSHYSAEHGQLNSSYQYGIYGNGLTPLVPSYMPGPQPMFESPGQLTAAAPSSLITSFSEQSGLQYWDPPQPTGSLDYMALEHPSATGQFFPNLTAPPLEGGNFGDMLFPDNQNTADQWSIQTGEEYMW